MNYNNNYVLLVSKNDVKTCMTVHHQLYQYLSKTFLIKISSEIYAI